MSAHISFSASKQHKYDTLVRRFDECQEKDRYDFIERVLLFSPWHRKSYRKVFLDNVFSSQIFEQSALHSLEKLYGRIGRARDLAAVPAYEGRQKREILVFDLRQDEIARIQVLAGQWKRKTDNAFIVANAVSAEVSEEKKDILRAEKDVLTLLEHSLALADHNAGEKVFIATTQRDVKIQGIARTTIDPGSNVLYLSAICTHPDNLGVIEKNEYTLAGVGTALMLRIFAHAVENVYSKIELASLNASDEWYKRRFGFRDVPNSTLLYVDSKGMKAVMKQQ